MMQHPNAAKPFSQEQRIYIDQRIREIIREQSEDDQKKLQSLNEAVKKAYDVLKADQLIEALT